MRKTTTEEVCRLLNESKRRIRSGNPTSQLDQLIVSTVYQKVTELVQLLGTIEGAGYGDDK